MTRTIATLALAICAATCLASPATARRTAIDGNGSLLLDGYCDANGTGCTPVKLGYDVDFGSGPLDSVLVYGNGLLSFGPQVADLTAFRGSLADYGVPVVAIGLNDALTQSMTGDANESATQVFYQNAVLTIGADRSIDALFEVCPDSNTADCRVNYRLTLTPDAQGYLATATYSSRPMTTIEGYSVPGVATVESDTPRSGTYSFQIAASFGSSLPTTPVPEPASWTMAIAGCGLAGAALRLHRRRRVPHPSAV